MQTVLAVGAVKKTQSTTGQKRNVRGREWGRVEDCFK